MLNFSNPPLKSGTAADLLKPFGIQTFHEAVLWVWKLPYGRTSVRSDYLLVPTEQKGACSAKHAFLAALAKEHDVPLILNIGIFMMNRENTPEIGTILERAGLSSIPEAHCYLRLQNERYDFTFYQESKPPYPDLNFLYEEAIMPNQIGEHKTDLHRRWIRDWAKETNQNLSPNDLWALRESCIEALSFWGAPDG